MDIFAKINGLKYTPFLCRKLNIFDFDELDRAFSTDATFILEVNKNQLAVSWWVSPKRTRSYPYTRVYDSLDFYGKKVTIIPIVKDEGKRGDRDFLQWDTVSLMSLLGVYVIISYYTDAKRSSRYRHKITDQRFDLDHIKGEIQKLLSYQSDALHWNISQIDNVGKLGQKALKSYLDISERLDVEIHSFESAERRINRLFEGKEIFMGLSRDLAEKAQKRESITAQPKEYLTGEKAMLTIKNYLGGYYYFTCDEVEIHGENLYLIEGKHTKTDNLPSLGDIKDGLLKMMLFTNLEDVRIGDVNYNPVPILKLTTGSRFDISSLNESRSEMLGILKKEAEINGFRIVINHDFFI
ncbi:hypothetical protein FHEFKHOI_01686 [Candidatus Methanoperedenaceae archaeon GB50]|nr:hypothetical protein AIOGIFDO_01677 [Candidatus Methanoperedenaceae archaeon GB37]CAD7774997.1 hypothetical protein FHEFKHOI_01686 [Candidatus Methanoperedenaceae archaeon GB50]